MENNMHVPVLIVGGGGTGLSLSSFLSDFEVPHLLVERHPSTSNLPKAHVLNARTMEALRQHRIAESVYKLGAPVDNMCKVTWSTGLAKSKMPFDGLVLAEIDAFGGRPGTAVRAKYELDSPALSTNLPQIRLEPLLRKHAEERNPGKVLFSHEVTAISQDDNGCTATIKDLVNGAEYTVKADYIVGADGGRFVGPALGIEMLGLRNFKKNVTVHFAADLSQTNFDDQTLMTWIVTPNIPNSRATLVKMGPRWDRHSEEYSLHFSLESPDEVYTEAEIVEMMRDALGLPDLQPHIFTLNHWYFERLVAETYSKGRVFLAGDAAHKHPPTTGLGLNTGIQDAHNIGWKLAAVYHGQAAPSILESYVAERRPVGNKVVEWAFATGLNHEVMAMAVGYNKAIPPMLPMYLMEAADPNNPLHKIRKGLMQEQISTQRSEFIAHCMDMGGVYEKGAFVSDGTGPVAEDAWQFDYVQAARPGRRMPHIWVERDGKRASTLDHVGIDWLLITGDKGQAWEDALPAVAKAAGVKCGHLRITAADDDAAGTWKNASGIESDGCILVRPDCHVAYRSKEAAKDAADALRGAFGGVLGK